MKRQIKLGLIFAIVIPLLLTFGVKAQPRLITQPSSDTPMYSVVVVNSKKLKMPLRDALNLLPGLECLPISDTNVPLNCPGLTILGGYPYNLAEGFPKFTTTDPNGRQRELRIDGLNVQQFSDFMVPGQCTIINGITTCPQTPPAQSVSILFNRPTIEFGFTFRPDRPDLTYPFIVGFEVSVNDLNLGFVPVAPSGVQYIGVTAPESLRNVTFKPIDLSGYAGPTSGIGPFLGDKFYYK